ncbi:MAG: transcriptional repressor [Oscillospiraceae bacterium]|nr:transcriptional repressor [Oscillospiraceae bacterium]
MNQRNTFQRTLTLDAVHALANHPTADDVYNYVHSKYPQISRTAVYRNLNKLCDSHDLSRVKIFGSADRFDHNLHSHYHFICDECGSVSDLDVPYMDNINDMFAGIGGRQVNAHQILFDGLCECCVNKSK